ncbi:MAG: hypothetical protein KKB31_06940 [Nanoarchaeota archaeon]|nr:hypothetical protein [Nanoarchaeota archaeon]
MNLPNILGKKHPSFSSRRKIISRSGKFVKTQEYGLEIDFPTMISHRIPIDPEIMAQQLNSSGGFIVANMGVSASIVLKPEGTEKEYLLVCICGEQEDKILAKLISGYNPSNLTPEQALLGEVAEEILVVDEEEKISQGFFNALGLTSSLPSKYFKKFLSGSSNYSITDGGSLDYLRSTDSKIVQGLERGRILYDACFSSAQIIFPLILKMPLKGSLYHSEDSFNEDSKELEIHLNKKGILLLERNKEKFTGNTFFLVKGELVPGPRCEKILLHSSFASKNKKGVVIQKYIPFSDCLEKQE